MLRFVPSLLRRGKNLGLCNEFLCKFTNSHLPSVSAAASEAPPILIYFTGIHYDNVIEYKKRKR